VVQNPGGSLDLTPWNDKTMTQMDFVCATGESCLNTAIPLKENLRCASCGFCMHAGCGVEIVASGKVKAPPPEFNHICNGCVILRQLENHVKYVDHTRVLLMRHPRVKKVIALQWPVIDVICQKHVDEALEQIVVKNKELEERKNAYEEAEELEEAKAKDIDQDKELEEAKAARDIAQAKELKDANARDIIQLQADKDPYTKSDTELSSSSDGDIAKIIGVKPGRAKPKPDFNNDDDSDATMSEAHSVKSPDDSPKFEFSYTGLPETIETIETKNTLPFVTPNKKGRQKKYIAKPKTVAKPTAPPASKPSYKAAVEEDDDTSKNTNDTDTTRKKGDKHRSSTSTRSTAASTAASSDLIKVYINVNLNVTPVAEKSLPPQSMQLSNAVAIFLKSFKKLSPVSSSTVGILKHPNSSFAMLLTTFLKLLPN
jgi:hypothetical protein